MCVENRGAEEGKLAGLRTECTVRPHSHPTRFRDEETPLYPIPAATIDNPAGSCSGAAALPACRQLSFSTNAFKGKSCAHLITPVPTRYMKLKFTYVTSVGGPQRNAASHVRRLLFRFLEIKRGLSVIIIHQTWVSKKKHCLQTVTVTSCSARRAHESIP